LWFATGETVGLFVWYDDGDSSQWVQTNGGSSSGGTPVTIVEDDVNSTTVDGWQVVGDVLIQWTNINMSGTSQDINFPVAFMAATFPGVSATPRSTNTNTNVTVSSVSATGLTLFSSVADAAVRLIAIGVAPENLRKPKTVIGEGVMEFHDPTGAASWRIIGKTLECWGNVLGSASGFVTVTLPKTYTNPQFVSTAATGSATAGRFASVANPNSNQIQIAAQRSDTQAYLASNITWRTIGEWDGVS
jgi:hypothetical protein